MDGKTNTALAILLALGLTQGACDEGSRESEAAALIRQKDEIIAYAQTGQCVSGGACRFSPMGTKACGGPTGYIVYSTSLDTTKLLGMIAVYTAEQDAYNRKWGIASDCSVPPPPDSVGCANGACVGYWGGIGRIWN